MNDLNRIPWFVYVDLICLIPIVLVFSCRWKLLPHMDKECCLPWKTKHDAGRVLIKLGSEACILSIRHSSSSLLRHSCSIIWTVGTVLSKHTDKGELHSVLMAYQ